MRLRRPPLQGSRDAAHQTPARDDPNDLEEGREREEDEASQWRREGLSHAWHGDGEVERQAGNEGRQQHDLTANSRRASANVVRNLLLEDEAIGDARDQRGAARPGEPLGHTERQGVEAELDALIPCPGAGLAKGEV